MHSVPHPASPRRLLSVDVLRGLVMFIMLLVNDLAGVDHLPKWLKHFEPPLANGMTFVDVVFPAFLFVVGVSIPLAVDSRRDRGLTTRSTLLHIFARSLSLLLLGVIMVNFRGWGPWPVLALFASLAAFLHIGSFPRWANASLRVLGFLALACLILAYPRFNPDHSFHPQWWGILGLIGWAYLIGAVIYLAAGKSRPALITALALLIALYYASVQTTFINLPSYLSLFGVSLSAYINIGAHLGSHSAIAVAGVILGTSLLPGSPESLATRPHLARCRFALLFALGLALAALLTYPSFGVNKNLATPAWSLLSAALTTLLFIPTYLLTDAPPRRPRSLTLFTQSLSLLGAAALMAYLLQPLFFRALSALNLPYNLLAPTTPLAILRALTFATLLSALAILLHRKHIRLKL